MLTGFNQTLLLQHLPVCKDEEKPHTVEKDVD